MIFDSMCVYCEDMMDSDNLSCYNCNEYDGVMPVRDAIAYLGLSLEDYEVSA